MQSNNSMALVCQDLRIRQDVGHGREEYKQISVVDCMASLENRPCKHSGKCISRVMYDTYKTPKRKDIP